MAEQKDNIQQFNKSLNTELSGSYLGKNSWTHARNAINSTSTGDLGVIGNEPANKKCITTPYPIIGFIYLYEDNWAVFSTDDVNSEIGLYKEFTCSYSKLPGNFNCLGLKRTNLVTGVSRQNFDCTWSIYWSDKYLNSDRTLNIDNIPYVGTYSNDPNDCEIFIPTLPLTLDCSKIKLNRLVKSPCLKISKGVSGGSLLSGSYVAVVAYTVNGQRVTDYLGLSNVQSLFSHDNLAGSLDINVSGLDDSYDEYELTVISIVNQQTVARRIGLYSTNQERISLDIIDNSLPSVPLEFLPIHNPLMDSSDSISELGDNMIRVAPKSKFDFNYQPLANQITSKWVSVEYPADYHRNGGTNTSYPRDENIAYFIQWIYDDGDLSSSYHIPGRPPLGTEDSQITGANAIETLDGGISYEFEVNNSASIDFPLLVSPFQKIDDGYVIATGDMGYCETSEKYPVNKPSVWGNLCGKNIRHHKFPEVNRNIRTHLYTEFPISPITGSAIRVLAVKFNNIKVPVDNAGIVIPNIVGYRILKGSREGNKTVIANGIINNTVRYPLQDGSGNDAIYPNYPYNDVTNNDPFLSTTQTSTNLGGTIVGFNQFSPLPYPEGNTMLDIVTFHSPDTNFRKPFLGTKELKIYGEVVGNAFLEFKHPDKHPRHKLLTNLAFILSAIAGIGYAALKLNGKRSVKYISPSRNSAAQPVTYLGNVNAVTGTPQIGGEIIIGNSLSIPDAVVVGQFAAASLLSASAQGTFIVADGLYNTLGRGLLEALGGATVASAANSATLVASNLIAAPSTLVEQGRTELTQEGGHNSALGTVLSILGGINLFVTNWGQGTNEAIELLKNFSKWEQHVLQQVSHCFYNNFNPRSMTQYRHYIDNGQYLGSSFQQLDPNLKVNNLYRASTVLLKTRSTIAGTVTRDDTKQSLETLKNIAPPVDYQDPEAVVKSRQASSHYSALKVRLRNQYGQIGDVKQIPVSCFNPIKSTAIVNSGFSSPVIFGGDMYITRYTEKNTMFFFSEWLYGQPDGFEYDYLSRKMLPFPKYWIDSKSYDSGDFLNALGTSITSLSFNTPFLPSGSRALDRDTSVTSLFTVKDAYFYLFSSSVKDFYVESEINVGYRDWEEPIIKRHYDNKTFTGLLDMFNPNPEIIKADNFYKYDYSLSTAKTFINFASWANVQPTYYDPLIAETCYTKHPKRVIYSLPQQITQVRDSWRIFLANNYRDFRSDILTLKSIGENGAVIFFYTDSPVQIQGTETLQTTGGTKLTIGDGELLNQAKQNLTNADRPYQYGSCQNLRSIINTSIGLFWIGQDQGKIYTASQGIMNIALADMASWFARYLPYELLKNFPTFELKDNAITGIACQSIYDSDYDLIYFSKKDYKLKTNLPFGTTVSYVSGDDFVVNFNNHPVLPIKLGDINYFDNASWTMSYNARESAWLSWHDWYPDLLMPSKNTFSSIKANGIWKHNERCDLFCNYYGVDYPFEIEWLNNTGLQENTLRSVEYQLEVYKYDVNCYDRYLFLDANFDEAVIYNSEQCSGLLKLNMTPNNDPWASNSYPIFNFSSVDILYSRVENKYRFNTFFDLTDDRGQFTTAERMIWNTTPNGYVKNLNPLNLNYTKDTFERKKFRGYTSSVFLRRKISGNKKFLLNFSVNKLQYSPR